VPAPDDGPGGRPGGRADLSLKVVITGNLGAVFSFVRSARLALHASTSDVTTANKVPAAAMAAMVCWWALKNSSIMLHPAYPQISRASSTMRSHNINSQNQPRPDLVNRRINCWGSSLHRDGLEQVRHDEHHVWAIERSRSV
jgi:hypothetical protein